MIRQRKPEETYCNFANFKQAVDSKTDIIQNGVQIIKTLYFKLFLSLGPGRVRKGRDFDQGDESHSRPSGPATLFDFLETKMPIKESKGWCI